MEGLHSTEFTPGTLLAERYEVVRFLGSGGMGSVLLVHDRALQGSKVVLKFLHPRLQPDEHQFLRFQNEALLMRELMHQNIVRVFDIGSIRSGLFFLSMEYVQGQTLGSLLDQQPDGKLSFEEALPILYALASGLSHAHSKGIIHRDLKPDNILLSEDGTAKLTDFGLGKAITADLSLTDPGETVGTPYYMSPEQFKGERPDPRTDIYSFGILAYELVTGQKPFQASSFLELAKQHFQSAIPNFTGKSSKIPSWFQDFVEKCSAKNRTARFSSCDEILQILEPHLRQNSRPTSRSSSTLNQSSISKHWRLKWRLSRRRTIAIWLPLIIIFITVLTTAIIARKHHPLRMFYGPSILRLEKIIGADLWYVKWAFVEDRSDMRVSLIPEDLINSALKGRSEQVELLLASGLSPNLRDPFDRPLTELAIISPSPETLDILAQYGADLTVENQLRQTLLIQAAAVSTPQVVSAILKSTPPELRDIDAKDSTGKTALHYAIARSSAPIVEILIREGASVFLFDSHGNTPLMQAVSSQSLELVQRILTKTGNAGIDAVNKNAKSALFLAAQLGNFEITDTLLNYGANPNIQDDKGRTALIYATLSGNSDLVERLLTAAPETKTIRDREGKTAFEYAANNSELQKSLE